MARKRKSQAVRVTQASYDTLKEKWQDAEKRAADLSVRAGRWDDLVASILEAAAPDIEERVADAVEDAVSNMSITT